MIQAIEHRAPSPADTSQRRISPGGWRGKATAAFDRVRGTILALAMQQSFHTVDVRMAHYDPSCDPSRPECDQPVINLCWHEYIWTVAPVLHRCPVTLLVSPSRDGEWVRQAAARFGISVVRGSSTRSGAGAIRQLRQAARRTCIAISPDGPQGPRRHMAAGAIYLASVLKLPISPVGIGYDRPWRLKTWDHFAIPRPGSRARIVVGNKIWIPPHLDRAQLEYHRQRVERQLNEITALAERWAEIGNHLPRETAVRRRASRWLRPHGGR